MNLMYSCERVAELLDQQLDEPLSLVERARLRMHLAMCGNCSEVARQIEQVQHLSRDLLEEGFMLDEADLDPSAPDNGSLPKTPRQRRAG